MNSNICFLKFFSEMKGILGDFREMKISLKPNAKPVKQWKYRLNTQYKEMVKVVLDKIMDVGIIEPIEES